MKQKKRNLSLKNPYGIAPARLFKQIKRFSQWVPYADMFHCSVWRAKWGLRILYLTKASDLPKAFWSRTKVSLNAARFIMVFGGRRQPIDSVILFFSKLLTLPGLNRRYGIRRYNFLLSGLPEFLQDTSDKPGPCLLNSQGFRLTGNQRWQARAESWQTTQFFPRSATSTTICLNSHLFVYSLNSDYFIRTGSTAYMFSWSGYF